MVDALGDFTTTSLTQFDHGSLNNQVDADESPPDLTTDAVIVSGNQFNQDLRVNYDSSQIHAVLGALYGWDKIHYHEFVALTKALSSTFVTSIPRRVRPRLSMVR